MFPKTQVSLVYGETTYGNAMPIWYNGRRTGQPVRRNVLEPWKGNEKMPSLKDMRGKAKEAGLMKLDKLIAKRQSIPSNEFPIPVKELCERYERLYTGCINDVMRELTLLDQNLPSDIMPLRDEMTVCGEAFTVKSAPNVMIEGEMTFRAQMLDDSSLTAWWCGTRPRTLRPASGAA